MSKFSLARRIATTIGEELRGYWQGPFTLNNPNTPLSAFWDSGARTGAGITVNESTVLTYSAFWSGCQMISRDTGSLPLILYERLPDGSRRRLPEHPLYAVLHDRANTEMSAMSLREAMMLHVLVAGNAFAEIVRDPMGRVTSLHLLTPDRVEAFRPDLGGGRVGPLSYRIDGQLVLEARNVFHLRGMSWNGVTGLSVVGHARESIGLSLASERMGGAFFSNGAHPSGFLRHPGKLSKDAKQAIRESLAARHEGVGNAHRTLIIEDGMEYQAIGLSNVDSQFIESRAFSVTDVARWFSIPPPRLGAYEKATYSNVEQAAQDYVQSTLRPWLVKWEQEILLKLVEQPSIYAEHLTDALLRADTETRYAAYRTGRDGGWLSSNDIRKMENLDPISGGDTYLIPLNMQSIGGASAPTRDDNAIFQTRAQALVVSAAIRDCMLEAFGRLCRREAAKARSYQAIPSKLRAWVGTFYDSTERAVWLEQLRPSIKAWHAVADREGVDVDTACGAIIDRHFETSKAELLRIAELGDGMAFGETLQRKLTSWESDRAATAIDYLIRHGAPPPPVPAPSVDPPSRIRGMSLSMLEKWHKTQVAR